MNKQKQAFTLVELVIIVVILAILATIAFVSYNYMLGDARNSKITSDLNQIHTKIEITITEWKLDLFSSIIEKTENELTNISLFWTWWIIGTNYKAWVFNYVDLWLNKDEFVAPEDGDYVIWLSRSWKLRYDMSWVVKQVTWIKTAKVLWNYKPRTISSTTSLILSWLWTKNIEINNHWIRVWDIIITDWTPVQTLEVLKVDGDYLSFWTNINATSTNISLASDESLWLIADIVDQTKVVTDGGEYLPY